MVKHPSSVDCGSSTSDGTARAEAERRAEHPAARGHGTGVCCNAAHGTGGGACVSREQEGEEGRKEKEKEKGEKKRRKGKREKGKKGGNEKKEKEMPAGFAATVASRMWRRREAMRMRNEETGKVLNDD